MDGGIATADTTPPASAGRDVTIPTVEEASATEWRSVLPSTADRPLGRFRSSVSNQGVAIIPDRRKGGHPQQVFTESTGEDNSLMVLSTRHDIVEIREQQEATYRDEEGRLRRHYFDFVVTTAEGLRIALAYKPSDRVKALDFEAYLAELATRISPAFADEIKLITEHDFPPIQVANANLINDCRRDQPNDADEAVLEMLGDLTGAVRIADLRDATGYGGEAFRAIVRLIGQRRIVMEGQGRIGGETWVRIAGEVA
ncbi:hypothetical protein [Methylobacterium phyllostachyos]|uniref:hypothetical protein n=1 Tax=Methylobacterium phyllostachyos TaxID=582672 RepID=UPI001FCE2D1E|nr:hypothetical protein [Methylobacterium phyllostachyos]